MIIRMYLIPCPACERADIGVRDVPSRSYVNNYLSPDARKPVPADDRWRYGVTQPCFYCGASADELQARIDALDQRGLPDGARIRGRDPVGELSRESYREALSRAERDRGEADPAVILGYIRLGDYLRVQDPKGAADPYRVALERAERALGPDHETVADACLSLSVALWAVAVVYQYVEEPRADDVATRGDLFERARRIYTGHHGPDCLPLAGLAQGMSQVERARGRRDAALAQLERAIAICRLHADAGGPDEREGKRRERLAALPGFSRFAALFGGSLGELGLLGGFEASCQYYVMELLDGRDPAGVRAARERVWELARQRGVDRDEVSMATNAWFDMVEAVARRNRE